MDSLYGLQAQFIADLLGQNDAAALRMVRAYSATFEELATRWERALTDLLSAEEDVGTTIGQLNLLRLKTERLQALRLQTADQIARFARSAEREAKDGQSLAVTLGQTHAAALTRAALAQSAAGFETSFAQLPRGALESLVGSFVDGSPLRTLFDTFGPEAANAAQDVLFRALATGVNPRVAAGRLRAQIGMPLARAMATSRTTMLQSYRESNRRAFMLNDDVVKGWVWVSAQSPRTCASCHAQHGTFHKLSERMSSHVNCRCSAVPVTRSWSELGFPPSVANLAPPPLPSQRPGIELFAEQSDRYQLRVLGPGKLALYKSGAIDLQDLVAQTNDVRWGPGSHEATIAQALAQHGVQKPWLVLEAPTVPPLALPDTRPSRMLSTDAPARLRRAVREALAVR